MTSTFAFFTFSLHENEKFIFQILRKNLKCSRKRVIASEEGEDILDKSKCNLEERKHYIFK